MSTHVVCQCLWHPRAVVLGLEERSLPLSMFTEHRCAGEKREELQADVDLHTADLREKRRFIAALTKSWKVTKNKKDGSALIRHISMQQQIKAKWEEKMQG